MIIDYDGHITTVFNMSIVSVANIFSYFNLFKLFSLLFFFAPTSPHIISVMDAVPGLGARMAWFE